MNTQIRDRMAVAGLTGLAILFTTPPVYGAKGDANGDGFDDLAIGVPSEDIGVENGAGAVQVLYGSSNGLSGNGDQFWHQDQGLVDSAEAGDRFGQALAWGDFNSDGFDDLAIGVPFEEVAGFEGAGAVQVLYGSQSGLDNAGNQFWNQDSSGIADDPEAFDNFGSSLAAGDFDNDGFDDLAIGVPSEAIGTIGYAGAVHILYGSSGGLDASGDQFFHQDTNGVKNDAQVNDLFGSSLAAGDFNNDNRDDLAIGVPEENIGAADNAGAVNVLYGSNAGLKVDGDQFWHQDVSGIADHAEFDDQFGASLATGDFDGDGRDDLGVGIKFEDVGTVVDAGAVHVVYGSSSGLSTAGDRFFRQGSSGIQGSPQDSDRFGGELIAGDFDDDGRDDLAIGVEDESVGGEEAAGAVAIIYGSNSGLTDSGNKLLHQNSAGIDDTAEASDLFGNDVTSGDFDGDGRDDLAIGAEGEDILLPPGQEIDIRVKLLGLTHGHPNDIDVMLVGPEGDNIRLMSDAGGSTPVSQAFLHFDDDATASLTSDPIEPGVFKPTNLGATDVFPAPAPAPSSATELSIFKQTNPVGDWQLFVFDDFSTDDGGDILFGWTLELKGIGTYVNFDPIDIPSVGADGRATPYPSTITVPNEALQDIGFVHILYGSEGGITADSDQLFHQNKSGINNTAEGGDRFGSSL